MKAFPWKPTSAFTISVVGDYIMALEGALDIVERVLIGDSEDSLAVDYAGLGYEYHPAVIAAYRARKEIDKVV